MAVAELSRLPVWGTVIASRIHGAVWIELGDGTIESVPASSAAGEIAIGESVLVDTDQHGDPMPLSDLVTFRAA